MEGFEWETKKKGVAVIDAISNQGVNENSSGVWCEGQAEVINVA